jgi:hypothetical protein
MFWPARPSAHPGDRMFALSLAAVLALVSPSAAAETEIPVAARQEIELTVYENDLALIKDRRTVKLPAAEAEIAFSGVSRAMQPETALFRVLKGPAIDIGEQVFDFDVISAQKLLERSLGREVSVVSINPATGKETVERAKVLAVEAGLVLDIGGRIHTEAPGRIVYDSLPAGLRATPTLILKATGKANEESLTELSYLTGGLGWHADYVAEYDADAGRLDLTGWATIANTAGVDFNGAALKLVSGTVNRQAPLQPKVMERMAMAEGAMLAQGVMRQELGGYHLYDLGGAIDLGANETKQLSLLGGRGIAVKREYVIRGEPHFAVNQIPGRAPPTEAETALLFKNDAAAKLGLPLPAGVVRVYGQDSSGAPQFLGEDRVAHTPEGGEVRLTLGREFDVTAEREQTSYVRASDNIALAGWRIAVKNAKGQPIIVRVIEPMSGDWEVTKATAQHTKPNTGAAEWSLSIPAKGEAVLEYTVRTRF